MSADQDIQAILAGLDPTTQLLYQEVSLGKDAEEMVASELGRTMVGMARQDYADALISLSSVSWWRKGRLRDLQQKADNSKRFLDYLRELILRGRQATAALSEEEITDG